MIEYFECSLCQMNRRIDRRIRLYHVPERICVIEWPCWCWNCDEVSLAEYIPNPAEIIDEAKAWRQRDCERRYHIHSSPIGEPLGAMDDEREPTILAYYDDVLAWRQKRQSPGRCLFCGSIMVSLAASPGSRFEHPGCGGFIQGSFSLGSCNSSYYIFNKALYTTEGLIMTETQEIRSATELARSAHHWRSF